MTRSALEYNARAMQMRIFWPVQRLMPCDNTRHKAEQTFIHWLLYQQQTELLEDTT